jgi:hypothetical protein
VRALHSEALSETPVMVKLPGFSAMRRKVVDWDLAVEGVEDFKGRLAGESVGDAFADAVVGAGFLGVDGWDVVDLDLDVRCPVFSFLLAAS